MEFIKKKIELDGRAEVSFTQIPHTDEKPFPPFQIICTGRGVRLEGKSCTVTDMQDLQDFAKAVSEAWKQHLMLKPKIEISQVLP
jgi:hypothetical protein